VRYVRVQFGRFTNFGPAQGGLPKRFTYFTIIASTSGPDDSRILV
jgi:hypothetical protein